MVLGKMNEIQKKSINRSQRIRENKDHGRFLQFLLSKLETL